MAGHKYGARTGSRRAASVDPARPVGILFHVLAGHWATHTPEFRGKHSPEDCARLCEGFFASPGLGCDMVIQSTENNAPVRRRCEAIPCAWFAYQLRFGGAVLGVRACSDHVSSAVEEGMWTRSPCSKDEFSAWEIMTG